MMFTEGRLLCFDPFHFKNGNIPKRKYFIVLGQLDDEVIMASGSFTQGSSIELSCDGPIRAPYIAFMQGGLTYEYGKIGVLKAISRLG